MNTLFKTLSLLLVAALLAPPASAFSLFGIGKKKEKKAEQAKPGGGRGLGLPGIEAGANDGSPRMAQEAPGYGSGDTQVGSHPSPTTGDMPDEVVIRASGKSKLKVNKPPLNIEIDPFESIRESLKPDQKLLLAESPLAVVWRRTHPEALRNARVIQPYLTTFSDRPGIVFRPRHELQEVLQRKLESKETRGFQWSLTVADEEGKVFQHYEGSSNPPAEIVWSGENEQGEWIQAGSAYSPVYMFTDPGGTPYTRVGKPLRFKGIAHQERTGLHLSLDSAVLFGQAKADEKLSREGGLLVRSAADLVKRRFAGIPIRVESYAQSKALADRQASAVEAQLIRELMLLPQDISIDTLRTPYAEQRLEIVLLNR
jgi:hypothetical protein